VRAAASDGTEAAGGADIAPHSVIRGRQASAYTGRYRALVIISGRTRELHGLVLIPIERDAAIADQGQIPFPDFHATGIVPEIWPHSASAMAITTGRIRFDIFCFPASAFPGKDTQANLIIY
jgi:hypothetical protein